MGDDNQLIAGQELRATCNAEDKRPVGRPMGPPLIFSDSRRRAAFRRAKLRQSQPESTDFLYRHIADDIVERAAFMRLKPARALIVGDLSNVLVEHFSASEHNTIGTCITEFDDGKPWPFAERDFIASIVHFASANDAPGVLSHIRRALSSDGVAVISFPGAGSLPRLRQALLAADDNRPAARIHPQIDATSGAALMERAGFSRHVVDSYRLKVRYPSLRRLVADHRDQALTNVLNSAPPPLNRDAFARAENAFMRAEAGARRGDAEALPEDAHAPPNRPIDEAEQATLQNPRVEEVYEIITLTGWK